MPGPTELDTAIESRSSTTGSLSDSMVFRSLSSPEMTSKLDTTSNSKYQSLPTQNGTMKSSTVINSNPQDYINVDGATYKVSRIQSPRALPTETPSGSLFNRTSLEDLPPRSSTSINYHNNNYKDTVPPELERSSSNHSNVSNKSQHGYSLP